jgi:hypothetical protein
LKHVTLVLLLVSLLAAGCGDNKKKTNASATDQSTSTTVEGSANGASGNGGTTATTKKGSKASNGTTTTSTTKPGAVGATGGSSTTTTRPIYPVKMSLDKPCVRRGTQGDTQSLTVQSWKNDYVAYSTEYSDKTNDLSNPEYKTGHGYEQVGDDGKVKFEWKVPDTAPTGTATLHTIADGRLQPIITFKVVSQLGHC